MPIKVGIVRAEGKLEGQHCKIAALLTPLTSDLVIIEMKQVVKQCGRFESCIFECHVVARTPCLSACTRLELKPLFLGKYWGKTAYDMDVAEIVAHLRCYVGAIRLSGDFSRYEKGEESEPDSAAPLLLETSLSEEEVHDIRGDI